MAILYNFEIKLNQLFGAVGYFRGACANEEWMLVLPRSTSSRRGEPQPRVSGWHGCWPHSIIEEQNKEVGPQNVLLDNN